MCIWLYGRLKEGLIILKIKQSWKNKRVEKVIPPELCILPSISSLHLSPEMNSKIKKN